MDETIKKLTELRDFEFFTAELLGGAALALGAVYGLYLLFKKKK